jgi:hypothetical protein
MNYRLANQDLRILQAEAPRQRFGLVPGFVRVDWKPAACGGNMIYLRQLALPDTCSVRRTDVKLEAPPNLYEPAGDGRLVFYRNVWISPGIKLLDRRKGIWIPVPRLFRRDGDGFAYLCIHPDPVMPGKNILDFIRVMDLFLLNPGFRATPGEEA